MCSSSSVCLSTSHSLTKCFVSLSPRSGELHLMEEGKVEGESSSRAGRWIKEIFKKKEGELVEDS